MSMQRAITLTHEAKSGLLAERHNILIATQRDTHTHTHTHSVQHMHKLLALPRCWEQGWHC